MREGKK